jgi:hypothetical protein
MRRAFLSVILLVSAFLMVPASPATAAPYCGLVWGSLEKTAGDIWPSPIVDVRTGQHACYDRLVVDVAGDVGGYNVSYGRYLTNPGSGAATAIRGGMVLQITVKNPAHDENYNLTYNPANRLELRNVAGYRTFRQVVFSGTYEGYTNFGLGVRARLPFRVFVLDGPGTSSRLVVDVAHQW